MIFPDPPFFRCLMLIFKVSEIIYVIYITIHFKIAAVLYMVIITRQHIVLLFKKKSFLMVYFHPSKVDHCS